MTDSFQDNLSFAERLDADDPLAGFRQRFNFPSWRKDFSPIYLCGNSLGLQSDLARAYVEQELSNWAEYAVDGHFHSERPWMSYHRQAARGFAELTGAKASEVIAMNTLTVNLHLMMAGFYRPTESRYRIVVEEKAFPSDRYAAASQVRLAGFDPDDGVIEWRARGNDGELYIEDLESLVLEHGHSIALLLLPGVQYYTGQVLDMEAICELGRMHGIAVGLDLAHAIGNVELNLHDWSPDFACWCTYKYLNAGPGAIAGAFVPERHSSSDQALHGWWGNAEETRFKMAPEFDPAEGAELWQMSNPPILSLAPVIASLELFLEAGFDRLRRKSAQLTAYLEWLIRAKFPGQIVSITPADSRGCQLSLKVIDTALDARAVFDRLCEMNVTGDWREPDVIRVAPAPLYNSFTDVYEFARRLEQILNEMSEAA
ncbi:MAG: kynureninase [Woeseiaceae bacterium]|nr:kynureninase [Woeseiaceae bacterium]